MSDHVRNQQGAEKAESGRHPSQGCYTCLDYLRHRQDTLPRLIATKADREGRPGREVFEESMDAAHARHLDGEPLRPGGPTRITDPYAGRLAALMALASTTIQSSTGDPR